MRGAERPEVLVHEKAAAMTSDTDHGIDLVPPSAGVGDDGPRGVAPIVVHGGTCRGGGDGSGTF